MKDCNIVPFFFNTIKNFKLLVAGQFTAAIMWAVDLSLRPYLLKIMIDKLVDIQPAMVLKLLLIPGSLYIGLTFLNAFALRFENFLWIYINPGMKSFISLKLLDKASQLPYSFFQSNFAGSLASKFKDVMSGVPDLTQMLVYKLFSHILALFIALYTIYNTNYVFVFFCFHV